MKFLSSVLFAATFGALAAAPAMADVGVSIGINQPGFYGRIDINQPPPPVALVYPQPVVIAPSPVAIYQPPIYLHVPPGHERHWEKHCAEYRACGQPVYFVQDNYYREHADHWHEHGHGHGHDRDDDHGHGHGHDRDDDHGHGHGYDHDDDHGHGHGHGHD